MNYLDGEIDDVDDVVYTNFSTKQDIFIKRSY